MDVAVGCDGGGDGGGDGGDDGGGAGGAGRRPRRWPRGVLRLAVAPRRARAWLPRPQLPGPQVVAAQALQQHRVCSRMPPNPPGAHHEEPMPITPPALRAWFATAARVAGPAPVTPPLAFARLHPIGIPIPTLPVHTSTTPPLHSDSAHQSQHPDVEPPPQPQGQQQLQQQQPPQGRSACSRSACSRSRSRDRR